MDILSSEIFQQKKEKRKRKSNFHISTFFKVPQGVRRNYPVIARQLLADVMYLFY